MRLGLTIHADQRAACTVGQSMQVRACSKLPATAPMARASTSCAPLRTPATAAALPGKGLAALKRLRAGFGRPLDPRLIVSSGRGDDRTGGPSGMASGAGRAAGRPRLAGGCRGGRLAAGAPWAHAADGRVQRG